MVCIMLIHVKMPTSVGILTFISRINIASEMLEAGNGCQVQYLSFMSILNIMLILVEHETF